MAQKRPSDPNRPRKPRKPRKVVPPEQIQEYDSPWKEIIEVFFQQFMLFFFPVIAAAIDWSRPVEFLDKEFQRTIRRSEVGLQMVDKLIKVWLLTGEEVWILIHIEVQSQKEGGFTTRMYVYRYRIYDRYRRPVLSLAILGDDDPDWRPDRYETELLGNKESLQFTIVKLLDYLPKWQELEQDKNPFAVVVMAHLKALATKDKNDERFIWKKTLNGELYKRKYNHSEIFNLFRFIDWVMKLPEALEAQIQIVVDEYEEQQNMRYVTSIERLSRDQGKKEGKQEGFEEGRIVTLRETVIGLLRHRFQPTESEILPLVALLDQLKEEATLKQVVNLTMDVVSFADFMQRVQVFRPVPIPTSELESQSDVQSDDSAVIATGTASDASPAHSRKPRKPRRVASGNVSPVNS